MATSRLGLSSTHILPLLPVLTSTASLTFCLTEYWTLLPFLSPSIPATSLSKFWDQYLYLTSPGWIGFGLGSAFVGWVVGSGNDGVARGMRGIVGRKWYLWGTGCALGHYLFGYSVARIIQRIVYGPEEKAKSELRTWLKLHTVRTLLVDLPAVVCFVRGFLMLVEG
ncbi:hypothetical protein B0J14DRAFT_652564 [Halenospora varia]|nr:hypothetical protein B0J14DRAFT_652564 [Halenospora varia]